MKDKILEKVKIKKAKKADLKAMAEIASENFFGLKQKKDAIKWIMCNFKAFPRMQYFVAAIQGAPQNKVAGYILWVEKAGFRKESVWELEQIAVKKTFQGHGIGSLLIEESLLNIKNYLKNRKSFLKLVEVTASTQNQAQKLYKKTLGAKKECVIRDFLRSDEAVLIARFYER